MALKDIEVGTAMPADKQYKLTMATVCIFSFTLMALNMVTPRP
ncbi:putative integrase [Klebsiella pneumoniae]|nr:putative integrase [Klebsiella pneumoniae]